MKMEVAWMKTNEIKGFTDTLNCGWLEEEQ